jgi:Flp pilus assembly pilin Flp
MKKQLRRLMRKTQRQSGQALVEYALILALIAIISILVLKGLGGKVNSTLQSVNTNMP